MLYIEQPGGVGWSTCDPNAGECVFTDQSSADEAIIALVNWFTKYPDFQTHDLYVSGESYGGIYVPFTSQAMMKYNEKHANFFNLKGFIVGNGVTNWDYDTTPAFVKMGFWHGLYDYDLKLSIEKNNCNFSNFNPNPLSDDCNNDFNRFNELTQNINVYDVFRKCYTNG